MQVLENSGLYPDIGVKVLIEKSLVTENEGCLRVHDMLQEMGKEIVFIESANDAGKRSRIWSLEDANHVLGNKRGTEAIRGIVVRFDKPYVIHLDPEAFSSMSNLKLLIILHFSHGQLILHGLNSLSNTLKIIRWERYPLDFLPSQTQFNELTVLRMQHSKLKELWRGTQFLQSLKFIDLSHSTNLIRTPNFNTTPNLQRLILEGCTKLIEVHHSLGQHKNLVIVNFKDCKSIKTLPTKFEMNCLEKFVLSGCSNVRKLPKFGKGMERLSRLDLEETAISKLHQSLVNLTGLSILNLWNCKNLVCFPSDFQKLKAIKKICIFGCSRFSRLPENLNENEALEVLCMGGTAIKEVALSLTNLKVLSFRGCHSYAQLSSSSWNHCSLLKRAFRLHKPSTPVTFLWSPSFSYLSSLVKLYLCYCNLGDESLSSEIGNLSSLRTLELCGNNFVEFPSGLISKLQKLEFLSFFDCPMLKSLPQLPSSLSAINAGTCPLLKHYVRSQLLWEFIEQFESQTQLRHIEYSFHEWKLNFLRSCCVSSIISWDSQISDFVMQPTRLLVISGSEVPSWFHNQNYFCAEDFPYDLDPPTNVSFIVNKPDSFCLSEWWGIAVCLVLENDLESAKLQRGTLYWAYRVSEGSYSNSFCGCGIYVVPSCCHQLCIIYIRFSSFFAKQFQLVFFCTKEKDQKNLAFKIGKCGWRVLCKEDVERWQDTRYEGHNDPFIVEEDESISDAGPHNISKYPSFYVKSVNQKKKEKSICEVGTLQRIIEGGTLEAPNPGRISRVVRDEEARWNPPTSGWVKVNVNGAFSGTMGVGCGGVLRNEDGAFLAGFMHHIMEGDSFAAEMWALVLGLKMAWDKGFRKLIIETDSAEVVKLLRDEEDVVSAHPDAGLIVEAKAMIIRDWVVEVNNIPRSANQVAFHLAKHALNSITGYHPVFDPSEDLSNLIRMDCNYCT